jgi:hypothetical protein
MKPRERAQTTAIARPALARRLKDIRNTGGKHGKVPV